MAKKLITKSPVEFKAAVKAKIDAEKEKRIESLYNKAVDAINDGNNIFDIESDDLEMLPVVDEELMKQGFHVIRYFGDRALVRVI